MSLLTSRLTITPNSHYHRTYSDRNLTTSCFMSTSLILIWSTCNVLQARTLASQDIKQHRASQDIKQHSGSLVLLFEGLGLRLLQSTKIQPELRTRTFSSINSFSWSLVAKPVNWLSSVNLQSIVWTLVLREVSGRGIIFSQSLSQRWQSSTRLCVFLFCRCSMILSPNMHHVLDLLI